MTTESDAGENSATVKPFVPFRLSTGRAVAASQTRTPPSSLLLAIRLPSRIEVDEPRVARDRRQRPFPASQIRTAVVAGAHDAVASRSEAEVVDP